MKPMPTRLASSPSHVVAVATVTAAATTLQSRNQQTRGGPATMTKGSSRGRTLRRNHHRGPGRKRGRGGHAERAAGRAAVPAPDRGARRPRRPHRVQSGAPSASDRALLGIHPPERPRLFPQSRRATTGAASPRPCSSRRATRCAGRRSTTSRRERRGDPHRDPALVDARAERPLPPRPDLARRSAARRHHRQVRLRRPVPAHAVARRGSTARSSTPPASATRAPKASAPCGSTCAMQVAGRDDLAHIAIFDHPDNGGYPQPWRVDDQLGVGTARSRTADWSIPANQTEVIRHRFVVYAGDAGRRRDDQCVDGVQRQPVDVFDRGAVGHRAAGRTRRDVPLAAGGRGEHDRGCRLQDQRVGGRTDGHAADGVLLGRPRAAVGG